MKKGRIKKYLYILVLLISIGGNVFLLLSNTYISNLQSPENIKIIEAGVIYNNLDFRNGENFDIQYDFSNSNYLELKEKYNLVQIAGNGSEFEKSKNLMDEFSRRLKHKPDFDGSVKINALDLLEYSLDKKSNGINCRCKAQILNEMNLALGIYSRKVWLEPLSIYDKECHVVNEIWDTKYNKWIMLDISNNTYWVDNNKTPLSILEIREKIAKQEFCTPVTPNDDLNDLEKSLKKNYSNYLYIAKNMVFMEYLRNYSVEENIEVLYLLIPKNVDMEYENIISESKVLASPIEN